MKIKGTQILELEIPAEEQKRVCLEFLYKNFAWGEGYFVNESNNHIYCPKTFYSSHSFNSDVFIREADNFDKNLYELIKMIKQIE